jgi:hypothetical protein
VKRRVPGESLDRWFAEVLEPKLGGAVERGVVSRVQVDALRRQMADLCESRRAARAADTAARRRAA